MVFYCGSGVNACHSVLALTLAGRDDADPDAMKRLRTITEQITEDDPSLPIE